MIASVASSEVDPVAFRHMQTDRSGAMLYSVVLTMLVALSAQASLAFASGGNVATPCNIESSQVELAEGEISLSKAGEGESVLLLHGLFAERSQWHDYICRLKASGYRAIAPDLPGYGDSRDFSLEAYSLQHQADLIVELMQQFDPTTWHLAGNSMGGTIAALIADQQSDDVQTLAFVGGPFGVVDWSDEVKSALRAGVHPFMPRTLEDFDLQMDLLFSNPPDFPESVKKDIVQDYKEGIEHFRHVWDIVQLDRRIIDPLPEFPMPVLTVWGSDDGVFSIDGAVHLKEGMPEAQFVELPDVGHLPMIEAPTLSAQFHVDFMKAEQ